MVAKQPSAELLAARQKRTVAAVNKGQVFRGDRLRDIRERYGVRQTDLAELCGLTRTQITNLEAGNTEPSVQVLVKLAHHLGVTTDWLLGLTEFENVRD